MTEEIKPIPTEQAQPQTSQIIEQVKKDLAELKAVNDAMDAERLRSEHLRAERAKGGGNFIMPAVQPETPHEKWKREAKARYAGTGFDPT